MFEKTGVYHSELVRAGTIDVIITGEPQKSKFAKGGKDSYWIGFKYGESEHKLTLENDLIKDKLTGLRNHAVQLTATGSREDADIDVYDAAGPMKSPPPQAQARPAPQQVQKPSGPAPKLHVRSEQENVVFAKKTAMQAANAYLIALRAARFVRDTALAETGVPMSDSHFQAATASMFIYMDRVGGLIQSLPAHPIESPVKREASAPPETKPIPTRTPQRQTPKPEPADQDGHDGPEQRELTDEELLEGEDLPF